MVSRINKQIKVFLDDTHESNTWLISSGTRIKQADVVMLGYPFMYNMTTQQRRNDLEIYENVSVIDLMPSPYLHM
jgi:trehalose/maltose hydrolase-like predicted phosphorylase